MNNGIKDVKTIFARKNGEFACILDGKKYSSESIEDTIKKVFSKIPQVEDREILILLKGINMNDDELDDVVSIIEDNYPNFEIGIIDSMQDDYELILGVN
jgi:dihydroxyacetone kinase-like predicted kinase